MRKKKQEKRSILSHAMVVDYFAVLALHIVIRIHLTEYSMLVLVSGYDRIDYLVYKIIHVYFSENFNSLSM